MSKTLQSLCNQKSKVLKTAMGLLFFLQILSTASSNADIPPATIKTPPMVKEESVSTYLPSEAAPGGGLAINLIYSAKPRYKEGAPVLVVVPGGNSSQGLDFSMHAAQQGFVELRFAFPAGGKPGFFSSGIYDNRGIKSQEALRDVLRFAAGELKDKQGRTVSELLPFPVYNKKIGAVGWSNGGNTLLVTLGKFGEQLPFVGWIALYESPVGNMFFPPSLGGAQDFLINKHYKQGTAATGQVFVDYGKLRYENNQIKAPGSHKKLDEPEIKGVAYFDENGNEVWEESSEFAFPYSADIGVDKQIYPPQVTKALAMLPQFQPPASKNKNKPPERPATPFVSYQESLAYFRERDGSLYLKEIVRIYPEMAISIFGSHLDHLQRQPDHPHIALLYNSLLEQKPRFLRLNPSSVYVAAASSMKPSTFVENKPGTSIDADAIDKYLEPEGLLPDYVYMEAAAAELSDRVHGGKWTKTLEEPVVSYSNGTVATELPNQKEKTSLQESKEVVKTEPVKTMKPAPPASNSKDPNKSRAKGSSNSKSTESTPVDWPFAGRK